MFFHLVVIYKPESEILYFISKPLLLFSLLAFFIDRSANYTSSFRIPVISTLGFSLLGDVSLMWEGELYFMGGMLAFACTHILLSVAYARRQINYSPLPLIIGVSLALAALAVLYFQIDSPANLTPYLLIYGILIGVHFIYAMLFYVRYKAQSWLNLVGASLFIISDLLLAFNKFNQGGVWGHIAVMLTYGLAQYCIVRGWIHHGDAESQ